ncbi:MAG TPA: response regulator transcription factor [Bryobacteraceae bacterium]|nr:response regulator transcription factor [Bryobacteraceae bacterium]
MRPLDILLAVRQELLRRGLRSVIETQSNWTVVAEAATGREAVQKTLSLRPALVVMEVALPELNGVDATRQILRSSPQTEILIVSPQESDHLVREVLAAGARGFLLMSDAARDLIAAAEALSHHRLFLTRRVSETVLGGYLNCRPVEEASPHTCLSCREREVMQLVAEGKSSKQVGHILRISLKTVEAHRSNVRKKLGLGSLSELVRYAVRNQIVDI